MVMKNKYEFVKLCLNYEICIISTLKYSLFEAAKMYQKVLLKIK